MATISGDSAEAVAFALLEKIAEAEQWLTTPGAAQPRWNKTRIEILETYDQCYRAARGIDWKGAAGHSP